MDIVTPRFLTSKSWTRWKSTTFLRPIRELTWQGKLPSWNLKTMRRLERHNADMFTRSRSLWVHKLRGTWNWKCDELLEWGCGLVGGRILKATVLEGTDACIGLSVQECYEDPRKALPQKLGQREKGTENFMKHIQSLFHNRILLFMERSLPEHSSKKQFCFNKGIPLYSSSIQPSCWT